MNSKYYFGRLGFKFISINRLPIFLFGNIGKSYRNEFNFKFSNIANFVSFHVESNTCFGINLMATYKITDHFRVGPELFINQHNVNINSINILNKTVTIPDPKLSFVEYFANLALGVSF